jgi:hypothetical protein
MQINRRSVLRLLGIAPVAVAGTNVLPARAAEPIAAAGVDVQAGRTEVMWFMWKGEQTKVLRRVRVHGEVYWSQPGPDG